MVPANLHEFFAAASSVVGALVGLLFVAVSVTSDRLTHGGKESQVHRIRAAAALTAFTNALTISLFALIPEEDIGGTALAVGCLGLLFVTAALLSLYRLRVRHWRTVRDALFLLGLAIDFVIQVTQGLDVLANPKDAGAVDNIAILVIVCSLIGISRSWELIGAPSIGFTREVTNLVRGVNPEIADADQDQPPSQ